MSPGKTKEQAKLTPHLTATPLLCQGAPKVPPHGGVAPLSPRGRMALLSPLTHGCVASSCLRGGVRGGAAPLCLPSAWVRGGVRGGAALLSLCTRGGVRGRVALLSPLAHGCVASSCPALKRHLMKWRNVWHLPHMGAWAHGTAVPPPLPSPPRTGAWHRCVFLAQWVRGGVRGRMALLSPLAHGCVASSCLRGGVRGGVAPLCLPSAWVHGGVRGRMALLSPLTQRVGGGVRGGVASSCLALKRHLMKWRNVWHRLPHMGAWGCGTAVSS